MSFTQLIRFSLSASLSKSWQNIRRRNAGGIFDGSHPIRSDTGVEGDESKAERCKGVFDVRARGLVGGKSLGEGRGLLKDGGERGM